MTHDRTVELEDGKFRHEIGVRFEGMKESEFILLRHRLRSGHLGERIPTHKGKKNDA